GNERDVTTSRAGGELSEIFAVLVLPQQTEENASRRLDLLGDGFIVAGMEFGRSRFTMQRGTTLPSVPVGLIATVSEPFALGVNSFKPNAHSLPSMRQEHSLRWCFPHSTYR